KGTASGSPENFFCRFLSAKGGQQAQNGAVQCAQKARAAVLQLDQFAFALDGSEVLADVLQHLAAVEQRAALKVQVKAAVIQVDGAHRGHPVVAEPGLGVKEA